jgi:hypothetical protein
MKTGKIIRRVIVVVIAFIIALILFLFIMQRAGWHYYLYFGVPILLSVVIHIVSARYTKDTLPSFLKNVFTKIKNDPFSIIGLFIAIIGIFFSGFWTVIEQHDSWQNTFEHLYSQTNTMSLSELDKQEDKNHFVFIIDNSKSLVNKKSKINDEEKKIIKDSWLDETFNDQQGSASIALQVKIMSLLVEIEKLSYNGHFSAFFFNNQILKESKFKNKTICKDTLRLLFSEVAGMTFDGDSTNFCFLLEKINNDYFKFNEGQHEKSEYTLFVFSDFLHDIPQGSSREKEEDKINEQLKRFKNNHSFSNLYFANIENHKKDIEIDIKPLIENVLNPEDYKIINFEEVLPYKIDNILEPPSMKFFYSSHLFSKELKSTIVSDSTKKIKFYIEHKNKDQDKRQEFFYQQNGVPILLSDTTTIDISKEFPVHFTMKGHIPFQYPFAELVVEDITMHIERKFEIVFFKELPPFLCWIIPLYFGVFTFYLILLFFPIIYRK